ncbi:MAG: L-ribulose-5-phosphate 3-epimerase [Sphingomonadales bacterium]|jgi:hexulose-6-phosphate isomerase|nr:L-ribulose-5-phosphate 3-epimerase [Sphingomonadales bacterium]
MKRHIRPSIRLAALPNGGSFYDRFRLAAEAGFEGIELSADEGPPDALGEAGERAGLLIHSVHCPANYSAPLSSGDPEVLARGIAATLDALETAGRLGADTLLLIPARVGEGMSYGDAWRRSHEVISRDILPVAAEKGIVLAIENVWNGFLLSPVDYAQYVASFESPFVRPYLDVGNIIFGRPEDWIDLAGPAIVKLHLKDFAFQGGAIGGRFGITRIGEGGISWPEVRAALDRIGFSGWGTLAEPDLIPGRTVSRAYYLARRGAEELAPLPGATALFRPVQTLLARRLLRDVMRRFRRYIA